MTLLNIQYLGLKPYGDVLGIMENIHADVVQHPHTVGVILVVQHLPTVTMGKRELLSDLRIPVDQLKYKGVAYFKIDRGGSVTVHEPGQIVVYPILHMDKTTLSVRSYVSLLEDAMIETAAQYGVVAARDPINPGVWVGEEKLGAVGIRISNKVTKHGIAFNVNNSLETFSNVIPCGIKGRGVTNLERAARKASLAACKEIPILNDSEVEIYLAATIRQKILDTVY